jgi:hypothetical protein
VQKTIRKLNCVSRLVKPLTRTGPTGASDAWLGCGQVAAAASRGSRPRPAFPSRYLLPPPPPRACSRWFFHPLLLSAPRWRWLPSTPCSRRSSPRRRVGEGERRSCGRVRPSPGRSRTARWWVAAGGGSRRRPSRRPCRNSRRGRKLPARPAPRGPPRRPPSWFWSLGEPAALVRQQHICSIFQHC